MPALSTSSLNAMLLAEARAAFPAECCGLLLGRAGRIEEVRPCQNVHEEPLRHFEIDPASLIAAHRAARAGGPAIIGYYHSHPTGSAQPSSIDRMMAAGDDAIWAIVGFDGDAGKVGWWRDGTRGFAPIEPDTI